MAHVRQSRPDSGRGFQVKTLKPFSVVSSSLGSGASADLLVLDPLSPGMPPASLPSAAERTCNNFNSVECFHLKAKVGIRP